MNRVLPQSVVDELRPLVEKYGGIGGGRDLDRSGCPLCIHGYVTALPPHVREALLVAGITRGANDNAVIEYHAARGIHENELVSHLPRLPLNEWLDANHVIIVPDTEYAPTPITYGTYA